MSKITLNNVGNLIDATTAATTINDNSAALVAAWDNTLSRDGTSPNQMEADLDMNSHNLLNLPVLNLKTQVNVSPVNGDLWFDGSVLNIRISGVTKTVTVT